MFITKQFGQEINDFIENKSNFVISITYNEKTTFAQIREVARWCKENIKGDGAGKIATKEVNSGPFTIDWHFTEEEDAAAFRLAWA